MMKKQILIVLIVLVMGGIASATIVTMDWVTVGDAGNAGDDTGYGSVGYEYQIGKYEVTNNQYCEFLNAVATTDTYNLYNSQMGSNLSGGM